MLGYNRLLKEKTKYEKCTGVDKYNEKSYDEEVILNCFQSFDFSNDRNYQEQNINVKKKIFIGTEITPDPKDKFDGLEIKNIKPVKGLVAPIIGWEVVV